MNAINRTHSKSLFGKLGGETVVNSIIEDLYDKMLADYRINRFFTNEHQKEQRVALKRFITASYGPDDRPDKERKAVLNDFFMLAFSRSKRKSFITGSDFGFFGLIIEQDHHETHLLCESHAALLKFMPDDFHYDVVLELLKASLQQLTIEPLLINDVLKVTEGARTCVLGR
ncbi:MAG: hypothetical protein Q9M50_14860 [Methylococcales bacterium]|nr:hypothetical protein [Methylococcales bacterium]